MKLWIQTFVGIAIGLSVVGTATAASEFGRDKAFYDPSVDKMHLGFSNDRNNCGSVYAWYLQPQTGRVALATTAGWPIPGNKGKHMACSAQHAPRLENAVSEALRRCNAMGTATHIVERCKIVGTK